MNDRKILNVLTIDPHEPVKFPVLNLGFRPFFLGASLFASVAIALWFLIYNQHLQLVGNISATYWHAHEMIYGYSLVVIAGFLLTAIRTWTGIQTVHGISLLLLVILWVIARVLLGSGMILLAGIFDLLFLVLLILATVYPILKSKQWMQLPIVSKLLFFFIGNLLFYLGALGIVKNGIHLGIYGGLYLVVGLILMMGRRVIPFFIEKGVDIPVNLYNSKSIDLLSLALFMIFFVTELMQIQPLISVYSALSLALVNVIRLIGWYTHAIWKKPLLWSLYLAIWSISLGFLLFSFNIFFNVSKFIVIHMLAYGGIGMITLGMMARVALGHTARDIHKPPATVKIALLVLLLGVIFRVLLCVLFVQYYVLWVNIAMMCWVIAFLIFFLQYFGFLTQERVDGQFG